MRGCGLRYGSKGRNHDSNHDFQGFWQSGREKRKREVGRGATAKADHDRVHHCHYYYQRSIYKWRSKQQSLRGEPIGHVDGARRACSRVGNKLDWVLDNCSFHGWGTYGPRLQTGGQSAVLYIRKDKGTSIATQEHSSARDAVVTTVRIESRSRNPAAVIYQ